MPCNGFLSNGQDSLVQPLLTDYYQITMCYGYWKAGIHNEHSVFDLFFRFIFESLCLLWRYFVIIFAFETLIYFINSLFCTPDVDLLLLCFEVFSSL